mgnify:FL=1
MAQYVVSTSIAHAAAMKDKDVAYLAGGTELNRLGSFVEPQLIIPLTDYKVLKGISFANSRFSASDQDKGTYVRIGSLTTFQELIESSIVPSYLKEAASFMSSLQRRNMATIGGNVALHRDDSYLCPTLMACDAKIEILGSEGKKFRITVCDFILSDDSDNYLILAIYVPVKATVLSKRYANTASSHGAITFALGITNECVFSGVAVKDTYIGPVYDLENFIAKGPSYDEIQKKAKTMFKPFLKNKDDIFGSAKYKDYLLSVTAATLGTELLKTYFEGGTL